MKRRSRIRAKGHKPMAMHRLFSKGVRGGKATWVPINHQPCPACKTTVMDTSPRPQVNPERAATWQHCPVNKMMLPDVIPD